MIKYFTIPAFLVVMSGCTITEHLDYCQTQFPDRNFLFNIPEVGTKMKSSVYDADMLLTVTQSPKSVSQDCSMIVVEVSAMNPLGNENTWNVDSRLLTTVDE